MKAHIAETISDLKQEHVRLGEIIALLETWGNATQNTQGGTVPAEPHTLSVAGSTPAPATRPEVFHVEHRKASRTAPCAGRKPARRAVSSSGRKEPNYHPKAGHGAKQLVVEAIAELTQEPFTLADVRAYLEEHHPEFKPKPSTISVAICNLRSEGLIRDTAKVRGPKGLLTGYKRGPDFKVHPERSRVEEEFRKLSEEAHAGRKGDEA